jgi:hypothetical protein
VIPGFLVMLANGLRGRKENFGPAQSLLQVRHDFTAPMRFASRSMGGCSSITSNRCEKGKRTVDP